jgi:F-type H+-transporting ATPase subunit alpha
VEILKQGQYAPVPVEKQVAIIYLGTKGLLRDVPVEKVKEFESQYLASLEKKHPKVLENFRKGKLEDGDLKAIEELAADIAKQY